MGKKGNLGKMKGMLLMALLLFCAFLTGCSLLDIKDGGLGMTNPDYVEPEKDEIDEENSEKAQYEKDPYEKYRFEKNQHEKNPDEEAQPEEDQAASWLSESGGQALAEEQESLRDYGAVLGAAFLGYTADYSFPGKQKQREETYPYLEGIPAERIIEYEGDEWYVILPEAADWSISVEACNWNEDFTDISVGELLWEGTDGLPVILRCNLGDLHSNVRITARKGSWEVFWYPYYLAFAGEIEPTEEVMQLVSGSYMPEEGYLYGMEGSWYCDSAETDAGEPYFYSVTFLTGEDGFPLDMWYYGGFLNEGVEEICFFWDGSYAYGDPLGESLEFWLNAPDGIRSGTIWLNLEGDYLSIQEMEGDAFFPFTGGSVETFYLRPEAEPGENGDFSGNEIDLLLAQAEVQEKLNQGMAIRDVDGMDTVQGEACVLFALGTEHPDQFVAEYYYAVSSSGAVYRMDDLTGEWEPI